ncbi:hypothetical protein HPP92_010060 [Vanilla planifolia]|uniref:Calmodulin-binding domain-containing protein n=1 Tax=Vanilla planifolia TaxID=51239 RepID=A0A835V3Q0_VANPL|nr:hypothetical protein HPP92_010157 [Vanilla planifolia]KAG0481976.1 hypothetical protein HPP92_010060 [Vanilla planifolia]
MSMTASMLKVGGKKVSKPNAAASLYKSNSSVAPKRSVKSQVRSGRLDSEKVEEKILYVVQQKLLTPKHIKMRSPQQSSTSFPSRSSISCSKNVLSSFKEAKGGAHLQSAYPHERKGRWCPERSTSQRRLRFRNANGAAETQSSMGEISMKSLTKCIRMCRRRIQVVLFNDVIEETANRLAKVRKSKVKALL